MSKDEKKFTVAVDGDNVTVEGDANLDNQVTQVETSAGTRQTLSAEEVKAIAEKAINDVAREKAMKKPDISNLPVVEKATVGFDKKKASAEIRKWIRESASGEFAEKGITEGTSSSGEVLAVPQPLSEEILRLMEENGVTRKYAKRIPMTGRSLKYRVYDTLDEATFESEIGNRDATSSTFVDVEFVRENLGKINLLSNAVIQDSPEIVTSLSKTGSESLRLGEDKRLAYEIVNASETNETELAGTLAQGALTVKKMWEMINNGTWQRTGNEVIGLHRSTWSLVINDAIDETLLPTMNQKGQENFYGYPIVFLNYLDSPATDGTNKVVAFFTNLGETTGLGVRNEEVIGGRAVTTGSVGDVNLFTTRQTAIEFSEDCDINVLMPTGINVMKTAH